MKCHLLMNPICSKMKQWLMGAYWPMESLWTQYNQQVFSDYILHCLENWDVIIMWFDMKVVMGKVSSVGDREKNRSENKNIVLQVQKIFIVYQIWCWMPNALQLNYDHFLNIRGRPIMIYTPQIKFLLAFSFANFENWGATFLGQCS